MSHFFFSLWITNFIVWYNISVFFHFYDVVGDWCAPKLFDRLKCESKMKTTKKQGVGDMLSGL